jgi:hypothetical protein
MATVQARLNKDEQKTLARLAKQLGCTESQVVREGLRALAAVYPSPRKPKIIGMGEFEFGPPDLATNKKHMEGFGR